MSINVNAIFKTLKNAAVRTIQDLVERECSNETKKQLLDAAIKEQMQMIINKCNAGFLLKIIIGKYVMPYIPEITQFIYDLVKAKVIGVTKENG